MTTSVFREPVAVNKPSPEIIGEAQPFVGGESTSTAKWQACKIDENGSMTWADSNADFDNVALDLTVLSYS